MEDKRALLEKGISEEIDRKGMISEIKKNLQLIIQAYLDKKPTSEVGKQLGLSAKRIADAYKRIEQAELKYSSKYKITG